jgi:hypothetical protein
MALWLRVANVSISRDVWLLLHNDVIFAQAVTRYRTQTFPGGSQTERVQYLLCVHRLQIVRPCQ